MIGPVMSQSLGRKALSIDIHRHIGPREFESEGRPLSDHCIHADLTLHLHRKRLTERQAQTRSLKGARRRVIKLTEDLKELDLSSLPDPGAGIPDENVRASD